MTTPERPLDGLPASGAVLDGKYRIERVLGVGGMGAVLEATHLKLEEKVAIKVLLGELSQDAEAVARFTREAWAAAKIKSENVARVHDVGALPSGAPYLVMEYLEGCDLDQLLEERGALDVSEAVDYLLQACRALAEAHEAGIIHRDLKPGNLFRVTQPDGMPLIKVVDFGISKVDAAGGVTKTGVLMGSPVYMAPEQLLSSKDVGVTADVWSLGIILFELVAGRPPFDAETLPLLCSAVMSDPTPSLGAVAGTPPGLDVVISRCLEKKAADRYPSLAELAAALAPFGGAKAPRSAEYVARVLGKATRKIGTPIAAVGAPSDGSATRRGHAPPRPVADPPPVSDPPHEARPSSSSAPAAGATDARARWVAGLAFAGLVGGLTWWLVRADEALPPDVPADVGPATSVETAGTTIAETTVSPLSLIHI